MIVDVLICALWCVGILALIWVLAGWFLLPLSERQLTVLLAESKPGALERQLRTIEWLRAAGLSRGAVFVVRDGLAEDASRELEIFARDRLYLQVGTRTQLCAMVEMGWNNDEAGRTDDSRDGAERPVSEPGKRI